MVVPLLLVARSFSHCVQFIERYYEIYYEIGDRRKSAELALGSPRGPRTRRLAVRARCAGRLRSQLDQRRYVALGEEPAPQVPD